MRDVAVVVPLFNGAEFIAQTIESVLAQTQPPAQFFVVDDGSTDESREIASSYSGVTLLCNPAKGSNSARSYALSQIVTQHVAFLDHDDVWHPRHLELACQLLARHDSAAGVHCNTVAFDHGRTPRFRLVDARREATDENIWDSFPFAGRLSTPSAVVLDTEYLRACGGWPTWTRVPTDAYMWFRLGIERRFIHSTQFTVAYRRRPGSLSSDMRVKRMNTMSEDHIWLLAKALEHYKSHHPSDDASALDRRLDAFRHCCQLLCVASACDDSEELADVAIALQRAVQADSSGVLRRDLPKFVSYRMKALLQQSPAARRAWLRSYARWPTEARPIRDLWFSPVARTLLAPSTLAAAVRANPTLLTPSAFPRTVGRALRSEGAFHRRRFMRVIKGHRARALRSRAHQRPS